MKTIESHLPILEKVFRIKQINTVLEFGMGMGSTVFFLNKCKDLTSIEMKNEPWHKKMSDWYTINKTSCKFNPILALGPDTYKNLTYEPWYDLIFVDGHGLTRWNVINDMFSRTDLMMAHDTQQPTYQWSRVKLPPGWIWKDIKKFDVWTSIITKDRTILDRYQEC